MDDDQGDRIIAAQIEYYRARAPEYDETFRGAHDRSLVAALDAFAPRGDVLELACGTGAWTESLVRHPVDSVLAVDASPEMLEFHARRIRDPRVTRVVADLFGWVPPRRFDVVTFAFWISHVPPARLASFWGTVAEALADGGRVLFVDQDTRGAGWEDPSHDPDYPTVQRPLLDGRRHTAIKVYHDPADLQARLEALGWDARVKPAGDGYLIGAARRR
ncbi:MAG: class I SAM-dependent methyltransferase [Candidatus Limnocylindria bacterium]